jgi:hypothetical protein
VDDADDGDIGSPASMGVNDCRAGRRALVGATLVSASNRASLARLVSMA